MSNPFDGSADKDKDCLESIDTFIETLGDWKEPLAHVTSGYEFKMLFKYVKGEYNMANNPCYPPRHQIFNAYQQSQFNNIKVVILGQDPYINYNEAMGMCFSINQGVKVPPSLKNIYCALENDSKINFTRPNPIHGDLTAWARQGVFMLNAVLTVRQGKSNSHQKKGWEAFTKETLR